ncbi:antigenic thaumatin domain-containing protein [Penicillium cinerascens]|uniref:Antigenic thaumatin domain-containing protein n=1 Tax=Penicillium cinerascens TaxID=70096 RepID=A0A9W9TAM6_9EURO|nr:antigenic thaumatin domain-containing protein [Penicillium cinerascens]XP_058311370.1 antigenic thaumatin domain-containing protein [Penicillium cinerascens]KAJ5215526.1 antigenic thaumatin domain-containing protein [Penicillium cinerascens]KAJ5215557.1 antigenic thaumatin domain-containing protein [Penicillium cinerascens]
MHLERAVRRTLGVLIWCVPLACLAEQRGNIVLYNNCRFPLYVEGVAGVTYLDTELKPTESLSHPFRLTVDGVGSSLKVSTRWRSPQITQIEYSACFGNESSTDCRPLNKIYYDLSKINDPSNTEYGVRIEPSYAECATINCPANVYRCDSTYYQPNDNYATKACDVGTDLKVVFCPYVALKRLRAGTS